MTNWLIKKFISDYKNTEDRTVRMSYGKFSSWVGIVCNVLLFIGKFIAGTLSSSVSITADAVNNLSDASSSIISLFGFKMSEKPADEDHPFGHGRYEYLSGLMVAFLIMVIGIELFRSSIDKVLHPADVEFSLLIACILIASILMKLWMALFNTTVGKKIKSETLIATAADSRNDVISTLAVLIASTVSYFTGWHLDGIMGVLVAIFILYSGFGLVKDTLNPLLGTAPDPELVNDIQKTILSYDGVLGTHDLMVHDYGPGRQFASVHVEMAAEADVLSCHDIIDNMENDFKKNFNLHMIIHYDPVVTNDPSVTNFRHWLSQEIKKIDENLTIHDLRLVPGTTHTNVIFDCVVPHNINISASEITAQIKDIVSDKYPTYRCVITIDASFAAIPH
jgi:cation diffusion facilitator family transporter